ncbi:MAG TPA: hypothetical protein PL090_09790, partial [Syntrophales bacterium]|nr:hypothetical protein [Syntrophales bacterium]
DPVLIFRRDAEVRKNEKENEKVVNAERQFDKVSGEKFQGLFRSPEQENPAVESKGEAHPGSGPQEGFLQIRNMGAPFKGSQVCIEQAGDDDDECGPQKGLVVQH